MIYSRDIKYMTFDIFKASAIQKKILIASILSMKSILIQTLIKYLQFYIIKTDTSILFSFSDMD